jgi:DNA-binding transcriptional regulator YiaG
MGLLEAIAGAEAQRKLPPPEIRRLIREAAHVSQAAVASELDVSAATVSRWESGDRTPRGRNADAYLSVLETLIAKAAGS